MADPPDARDPDGDLTPPDGWVRPSERLHQSSPDDQQPSDAEPKAGGDVTAAHAEPVHVDATSASEAVGADPDADDETTAAEGAGAATAAGTATARAARRRASRKNRRRVIAGVAALALIVAAVGGVLVATSGGTTKAAVKHHVHVLTTTTVPGPPPSALIATTKVSSLQVYDSPNGKVVGSLSAKTDYNQPRTLLVAQVQQPGWLQVLLPQKPNDTTGWVRTSDTTQTTTDYALKVSLSQHHLWLTKAGAPVVDTAVVIGTAATPTPTGLFYVTDPVNLTSSPNGPYGAFALGLSGYSNTLGSFDGGPPQIAVHGTPYPNQVGQDLSNGCVRVPNPVILQIAGAVPLGTPVTITA